MRRKSHYLFLLVICHPSVASPSITGTVPSVVGMRSTQMTPAHIRPLPPSTRIVPAKPKNLHGGGAAGRSRRLRVLQTFEDKKLFLKGVSRSRKVKVNAAFQVSKEAKATMHHARR